jgi:hypothetical protein
MIGVSPVMVCEGLGEDDGVPADQAIGASGAGKGLENKE